VTSWEKVRAEAGMTIRRSWAREALYNRKAPFRVPAGMTLLIRTGRLA